MIVAVHNAMPYLTKCIRRLCEQTIGMSNFEVIAVDDGSTDGSGERLDSFAKRYPATFKVSHQHNSGGPAAPSNRALDQARGRYVFFIGADDYLNPTALERMVALADANDSDIVCAKMVGANGRYVPAEIFARDQIDVDLFDSALPFALSNTKLFRRDLIEKHRIRFPEHLAVGSDMPFTLEACLNAERISVLADDDYYFAVRRKDGSNITYRSTHEARLLSFDEVMRMTAGLIEEGPHRDAIMRRHFTIEMGNLLRAEFLGLSRDRQLAICAGVGRLVDSYMTPGVSLRLDVSRRVRLVLAQLGHLDALIDVIRQDQGPDHAPIVVDGDSLYLGYRCFRDDRLALPDELFHVTDSLAASIANRFTVTRLGWGAGPDKRAALTVTAHSPVDLSTFAETAVELTVGKVRGLVNTAPSPDGVGTTMIIRFPVDEMLADCQMLGDRQPVRVRFDLDGERCDVPLRLPAGLRGPKQFRRRGQRPFGIGPAKNKDGHLVIDIVPITMTRVFGVVRRAVSRQSAGTRYRQSEKVGTP